MRQLRLRDIGGIIVIDFIDMVLPTNRELSCAFVSPNAWAGIVPDTRSLR